MSSHLVSGVPLPDAVAGHPALDFCNTRAGWGAASPKEYLSSARVLLLWAQDAGLLPSVAVEPAAEPDAEGAHTVLGRALRLREHLYRCALGTGAPQDWVALSREVAAAHAVAALTPGVDGRARWRLPAGSPGAPPTRPEPAALLALHAVALAAEDLLVSLASGQVGSCPGAGCGWLFLDRRRRRRWCQMAVCGNRAKARRHAQRGQPRRANIPEATLPETTEEVAIL